VHLVPAAALREAAAALGPGAAPEEVLAAADALGSGADVGGGGGKAASAPSSSNGGGGGSSPPPSATNGLLALRAAAARAPLLARLPRVLTLGLVWESPAVPPAALAATVDALPAALRTLGSTPGGGLRSLFSWCPSPPPASASGGFALRALVCYHGRHYVTFAVCDDLRAWVALDDGRSEAVGAWAAVAARLKSGRLQPCLAFYCEQQQQHAAA
jgi:hypothetical protein